MGRPPKNSPSFFKVFHKDTSSSKLKLPPAYTLHMMGILPHRVSLRDQYGNHWPVKLANIENQLYFEEGWAKFVEDNSIENEDFLFFQYCDDQIFLVKITGRNACDKEGVGAPMFEETNEEYMKAQGIDKENEQGNDEEQGNQPLEKQVDEENEEVNDEQQEEQGSRQLNKQVERELAEIRKHVDSLARKLGKPTSKDTDRGSRNSSRAKNLHTTAAAKRKRTKAPDPYGTGIFKSGILPQPKNPYFVTRIRPERREELYIPIHVLKDCSMKKLPDKATLRDSRGRTWPTKLTCWADGRRFYAGGLASFCRLNLVEGNDLCVCEFVKGRDEKDLVIQLQVVPTSNNGMASHRDQQRD